MGAVFAGDVAEIAPDAFVIVDAGDAFVIKVEVLPVGEAFDGGAGEVGDAFVAFRVEVIREALVHVLDDAEAVVHDGGADLEAEGAEGEELGGVTPVADAADAGYREIHLGVGGAALHHVEGDGFDRGSAIAAVRAESAHVGLGGEGVEVDVGDAVDRVDQRDGVGPGAFGRAGGVDDIGDVRGEFDDDRNFGGFHDPADNRFGHVGVLSDRGAHAAFAHAVRAAEVKFDTVGAAVGGAFDEFVPALAGVDHERGDDRVIRPAVFDFLDFAEVGFGRAVADQFDVVEADHALSAEVERGVAGGDVDDGVTDGFPDDAAPTGFEGAVGLVGGVGGRAAGDPERVGGFDSGEVDGEVGHGRK